LDDTNCQPASIDDATRHLDECFYDVLVLWNQLADRQTASTRRRHFAGGSKYGVLNSLKVWLKLASNAVAV